MAFTLRGVKVPPNSASLEEARQRVFDFFRTACRSIPSIIDIYNLDDVVAVSQLRSTIASQIRNNSHLTNPKDHDKKRMEVEELNKDKEEETTRERETKERAKRWKALQDPFGNRGNKVEDVHLAICPLMYWFPYIKEA